MSETGQPATCRNCGHELHDGQEADHHGWCPACRRVVVRRAGWLAIPPALVVLAAYLWVIDHFGLWQSTFVIIFLVLGVALAWVAWKVARRVLFDVVRARGVKPPAA
jgi:uncharacterized membrane protein